MRLFLLAIALLSTTVLAGPRETRLSRMEFLQEAARQRNDVLRYLYIQSSLTRLTSADRILARQYLAFVENEMGLYGEAVRDFPLRNLLRADATLPAPGTWHAKPAVDAIAALADGYRVVMLNEAHHDGHTRVLTLELLPRLRAKGFRFLALEALGTDDADLMKRGYPLATSGSEYLSDPIYGEIVREAIRLGFTLVPYDGPGRGSQDREHLQAANLYAKVLSAYPNAKLVVHAGYAHIDKARGRLGRSTPMAAVLRSLAKISILSVDQTDVREQDPRNEIRAYHRVMAAQRNGVPVSGGIANSPLLDPNAPDRSPYGTLVARFRPTEAVVFVRDADRTYWSASPTIYDISVVLPVASDVVSDYVKNKPIALGGDGVRAYALPPAAGGIRPAWLTLSGRRIAHPVDSTPCMDMFPCLIEARYAGESDQSVAADRYLFLTEGSSRLFLQPGLYRLRATGPDGHVQSERDWAVIAAEP